MSVVEKWIWLNPEKYPNYQNTVYSGFSDDKENGNYTVAEFKKDYVFDEKIECVELRLSADTRFQLYINGNESVTGPVNVGGDFLFNDTPCTKYYSSRFTVFPDDCKLCFFARVQMMPVAINDYSRGKGGFMLWAKIRFASGRIKFVTTDGTWLARRNDAYVEPYKYNAGEQSEDYSPACETDNIWHTETAPIKTLCENKVLPLENFCVQLKSGECVDYLVPFDKIYAGFLSAEVKAKGELKATVDCMETDASPRRYEFIFNRDESFKSFQLDSIGVCRVHLENLSRHSAEFSLFVTETHYPVDDSFKTVTDDEDINLVLDVCRHTLKGCRQLMHLDSPKHSEPLACTGDYYIESLMTSMAFGDMSLARFDIIRTAEMLANRDGRLFHTSYSLIWVLMLWDVYMITGDRELLGECLNALTLLLARFETYIGANGLLETPPDFMFVDWIYVDGISMHHPPKALGQTCLCAFYYAALKKAKNIYRELGEYAEGDACSEKAENLKNAVNELLYDPEKGLYFEGLNTPTPEHLLYNYMPQNTTKRYYMPHSDILCACFGICEPEIARNLVKKVMTNTQWRDMCQPYFKHYLFEAIFKNGLTQEYTLDLLNEWKAPVRICPKGLTEGFVKPEPAYSFDHSHAWGGTPLYSLPKALSGLRIIEPGYKKVALSPNLLGLQKADFSIPTPFGAMEFHLERGKEPIMNIPREIETVFCEL